jgi:phosphoserine phosphatase RsbU/P
MPRLVIESGNDAGMVYPLSQEVVTIGRSSACTIQIADKRISRHHVTLRLNGIVYLVEDTGSKNGSLLNGAQLKGRIRLKSGDRVQMGDTILVFERDPEDKKRKAGDTTRSGSVKLVPGELSPQRREVKVDSSVSRGAGEEPLRDQVSQPYERLKVLYEIADRVTACGDTTELLNKIMDILWRVVRPNRGVILLCDEVENTLEPVAVRVSDGLVDDITISKSVVEHCIVEQVAVLVSDAPSDIRFGGSDSMIGSRIRSVICAPIVFNNNVLGVVYVDSQELGPIYTEDELELVTGIANQAAAAVTNARLYKEAVEHQKLEKEFEIARTIQTNLLPRDYPDLPGVEFSAMSMPAKRVGGDYYDFIQMENGRYALVIADVSGKGIAAAILTAAIRASVLMETHQAGSLPVKDIVAAVNKWTCRDATNNMFVTMVYGVYDPATRILEYTNAGHCFPLLFKPDGTMRQLDCGGCFLGIMEVVDYEQESVLIEPGDTLVFYTDGVTDSQDSHLEVFGQERLVEVIKRNLSRGAQDLRDEIFEATLEFRMDAEQFDDLTIVVIKF